jgi:hypothetical protein
LLEHAELSKHADPVQTCFLVHFPGGRLLERLAGLDPARGNIEFAILLEDEELVGPRHRLFARGVDDDPPTHRALKRRLRCRPSGRAGFARASV